MTAIRYTEVRTNANINWYSDSAESKNDSNFLSSAQLTKSLIKSNTISLHFNNSDPLTRILNIEIHDVNAYLSASGVQTLEELVALPRTGAEAYNSQNGIVFSSEIIN